MSKSTSIFGIYALRDGVESAIHTLKDAHYESANISVLFPYNVDSPHEKETRAPAGVAVSAGTGAMTGGVLGSILGLGMLGVPGVGPFLAAGPVVAALSYVGVGSVIGGIAGGLISMGISDAEAKQYEGKIRKNGILLSVHNLTQRSKERAMEILKRTGAEDITSTEERSEASPAILVTQNTAPHDVSPKTLLENSQMSLSIKAIMAADAQKAAEYVSPSQPLEIPATAAPDDLAIL